MPYQIVGPQYTNVNRDWQMTPQTVDVMNAFLGAMKNQQNLNQASDVARAQNSLTNKQVNQQQFWNTAQYAEARANADRQRYAQLRAAQNANMKNWLTQHPVSLGPTGVPARSTEQNAPFYNEWDETNRTAKAADFRYDELQKQIMASPYGGGPYFSWQTPAAAGPEGMPGFIDTPSGPSVYPYVFGSMMSGSPYATPGAVTSPPPGGPGWYGGSPSWFTPKR